MYEIRTNSGVMFNFETATEWDINLDDIAHSLSNICRYGGHCPEFYSVAEHSCLVASMMQERGSGRLLQASGLMHDATEAYVGDMTKPLKNLIGAPFMDIESRIWDLVSKRFRLPKKLSKRVHNADFDMMAIEMHHMWPFKYDGPPDEDEFRNFKPSFSPPDVAKGKFLRAASILEIV